MRPLDPRLLRHASRARAPVGGLAGLGVVTAGLVIAQAWLLAAVIAAVFADKAAPRLPVLAALAAVAAARAAAAWASHALAHRASAAARDQLRGALLARVIALGPSWRAAPGAGRDTAALTQLATTGLDSLDGYFTSYLPALLLAAFVPVTVLAVITAADPLSGAVVAVTLPLVPLFGAFIGMATSRHADQRWRALATLAHHFHDVVAGLPTLRAFGRAGAQRARIEQVTGDYRRATMATLRLAFASSLALELIATMSVALVATEAGLRLAYGHLDLRTGLLVLILAPEAYLPLRVLGAQFHATADGLAAAARAFDVLEAPARPGPAPAVIAHPAAPGPEAAGPLASPGHREAASGGPGGGSAGGGLIRVENVSVSHEGRAAPAPAGATFTIVPGRLTVLAGPSGCGKTTLLSCLLGFAEPTAGVITPRPGHGPAAAGPAPRPAPGTFPFPQNGSVVLAGHLPLTPGAWPAPGELPAAGARAPLGPADPCPLPAGTARPALAAGWLPQDPVLFAGTVAGNIRLGWPGAPDAAVAAAARDAALDDVDLARVLGERGAGLSSGQRRRVALARALLPAAPLLLLDEPTAGLDAAREAAVTAALRRRAAAGVAVVAVSHRPALIAAADTVVDLAAPSGGRVGAGEPVEIPA